MAHIYTIIKPRFSVRWTCCNVHSAVRSMQVSPWHPPFYLAGTYDMQGVAGIKQVEFGQGNVYSLPWSITIFCKSKSA